MEEQWKDVSGYEGIYQVSNCGRLKSLARLDSKGQPLRERLLVPAVVGAGYLAVSLCKNGTPKRVLLHTLVLSTFVGPRPPGTETRHLDGVKTNNHYTNLAWGTKSENEADKKLHGTNRRFEFAKGKDHYKAKLTEDQVQFIRNSQDPPYILAKVFEVNWSTIDRIKKAVTWKSLP